MTPSSLLDVVPLAGWLLYVALRRPALLRERRIPLSDVDRLVLDENAGRLTVAHDAGSNRL